MYCTSNYIAIPLSRLIYKLPDLFRCIFFFFKQKTAYEIGLGIPAEPLFRSRDIGRMVLATLGSKNHTTNITKIVTQSIGIIIKRSEERRVGKECRYRWGPYP